MFLNAILLVGGAFAIGLGFHDNTPPPVPNCFNNFDCPEQQFCVTIPGGSQNFCTGVTLGEGNFCGSYIFIDRVPSKPVCGPGLLCDGSNHCIQGPPPSPPPPSVPRINRPECFLADDCIIPGQSCIREHQDGSFPERGTALGFCSPQELEQGDFCGSVDLLDSLSGIVPSCGPGLSCDPSNLCV